MSEPQAIVKLTDLDGQEVFVEFRPWNLHISGFLERMQIEGRNDRWIIESRDDAASMSFSPKDVKGIRFTEDGKFTIELEWGG